MSYELYYTSAPEGLKPGSKGFCSVAHTAGMPRQLVERLESISAYRHEFPAGSNNPANPIAWSHLIMTLTGKEYHILSRICDNGVDYSQRSNFLAHHLVLETSEVVAGGPLWLMNQTGVLAENWDGTLNDRLPPRIMPLGDTPAGPCRQWQHALGDAGWAGLLAETFVKTPKKPVGLVYGREHDVLALLSEVMALLPPALRWQLTFNTYFTSLAASVRCGWRCGMRDTNSGSAAARYGASGGLLINLTDPGQMPPLKDSLWVQYARTGVMSVELSAQLMGQPRPSVAPVTKAKVIPPVLAAATAAEAAVGTIDLAPMAAVPEATPLAPAVDLGAPAIPLHTAPPQRKGDRGWTVDPLQTSERIVGDITGTKSLRSQEKKGADKWKQLIFIYLGVLTAVAGVFFLLWYAGSNRSSSTTYIYNTGAPVVTTLPAENRATNTTVTPPPTFVRKDPDPVVTTPVEPVELPPIVITTDPGSGGLQLNNPNTVAATQGTTPMVTTKTIQLTNSLDRFGGVAMLRDKIQKFALPAAELGQVSPGSKFELVFPNQQATYGFRRGNLAGSLKFDPIIGMTPAFAVIWTDENSANKPFEVARVTMESVGPEMTFTWRSANAARRPEVFDVAYWIMQASTPKFQSDATALPVLMKFKPVTGPSVVFTQATTAINFGFTLPEGVIVALSAPMPKGWTCEIFQEWADQTKKNMRDATQVVLVRRPTTDKSVAETSFRVEFLPGWDTVKSTYTARVSEQQNTTSMYDNQLQQAKDQVQKVHDTYAHHVNDLRNNWRWWQGLDNNNSDQQLWDKHHMTRRGVVEKVNWSQGRYKAKDQEYKDKLAAAQKGVEDLKKTMEGLGNATKGFDDLSAFELTLKLTEDVPMFKVPLKKN
jgi:hypothetical protein